MSQRKMIDCSKAPNSNCSVQITGTEEEVLKVAVRHAVHDHGFPDSAEVRQQVRMMMQNA